MDKYLLIAEKASLMNAIMKVYNKYNFGYEIVPKCARGHLLRLKLPNELGYTGYGFKSLPIFPDKWEYVPIDDTRQMLKDIKDTYKKGKFQGIIHAGDPEVEGELIIREIIDYIGATCPVYRFFCNAQTEADYKRALENLKPISTPLYERYYQTGLARSHNDYIVGMNYSPAYSEKLGATVAIGRVKTFILGLTVKRAIEIENFRDEINYGVTAIFNNSFKGNLQERVDNKLVPARFDTKKDAQDAIDKNEEFAIVRKIESKESEIKPEKFYKLSTLQKEAAKYGFSIQETERTLQSLYEAGYVTYPRTNCEYIGGNEDITHALTAAQNALEVKCDADRARVLNNPKYVNPKELESEGHTAIMPTGIIPTGLNKKQLIIYRLVCRRFLSAFLPNAKIRKTTAIITSGDNIYKSEGTALLEEGFKMLYESTSYPNNVVDLPVLNINDKLDIKADVVEVHKQKPTPITEAELIDLLDNPLKLAKELKETDPELLKVLKNLNEGKNFAIGTQASRPGILNDLERREYILHEKGHFVPTETGRKIIESIGLDAPILNVLNTGRWEIFLEAIRKGEGDAKAFEDEIKKDVLRNLEDIKNKQFSALIHGSNSQYACPKCKSPLKETPGTFKCSCGFVLFKKTYQKKLSERQIKQLLDGKTIHVKGLKWNSDTFEADLFLDKTDYKVKRARLL